MYARVLMHVEGSNRGRAMLWYVLRDLRCFARPRFANNDERAVFFQHVEDLLAVLIAQVAAPAPVVTTVTTWSRQKAASYCVTCQRNRAVQWVYLLVRQRANC